MCVSENTKHGTAGHGANDENEVNDAETWPLMMTWKVDRATSLRVGAVDG